MRNCVSFFSAWSRKQPLGSWRCRASVPCLGGSFMSPVLPGVTVPTAWPPATSPTSEVESLCAMCISVAWGIFHPEQFFLTSVTKNNNNKPLGRKATFSFHGRGFDLMISRRGSSRSAGLCLQQRFHVALTSSHCVLLYLISCRAISVLQWEVCFTHSAEKRKEVASLNSEMWGRKAVGNQAQPHLPSLSQIVSWVRTCASKAVQILLYCWNLLTALVTSPALAFHKLSRCGVTGMSGKILDWNIIGSLLSFFIGWEWVCEGTRQKNKDALQMDLHGAS